MNEITIDQYISGQEAPLGWRIYRGPTAWIKAIFSKYMDCSLLDYLRGVVHNLNLQV